MKIDFISKILILLLILISIPQSIALIYPYEECITIGTNSSYSERLNDLETPIEIYDYQNNLIDKNTLKYSRGEFKEENYTALFCYNKSLAEGVYTIIIKPDSGMTIFKPEELNKTLYIGFADCEVEQVYNIQKDKLLVSYNIKIINPHDRPIQFNPKLVGKFGNLEVIYFSNNQLKDMLNQQNINYNFFIEPHTSL